MGRVDRELLERGLVRSRTQAAKLIAEGAVNVNGIAVHKASQSIAADAILTVTASAEHQYVSRAALKLLGALEKFTITVHQRRCLDAGASTGGFTQVLLEKGAREVVAADVGHDQLERSLRQDSRVQVHEGLNIRYLTAEMIGGQAELCVADLSFISLTLVIDALAKVISSDGDLLLLVKPQFEVGKGQLRRGGLVNDPKQHRRVVADVTTACLKENLLPHGITASPVPGQDGNREFFLWCRKPANKTLVPAENDEVAQHAEGFMARWWPTVEKELAENRVVLDQDRLDQRRLHSRSGRT